MVILPAIDIKDGDCVRLSMGEMSTAQRVADSYSQTAASFKAAGAEWIHMVDLNGAVRGEKVNSKIFLEVAAESGLKVELGGGIRSMEDIEFYLGGGISRIVLGSAAVKNPQLVREAVREYGEKIAVGIDAKNGMVATEGWTDVSAMGFVELARLMEDCGVSYIIYTDIGRDGMLSGPNLFELEQINSAVHCNIIASGGVTDAGDILALKKAGLYGAICGRSIYKGTLKLSDAIKISE